MPFYPWNRRRLYNRIVICSSSPYCLTHSLIPPVKTTALLVSADRLALSSASWYHPAQRGPRPDEDWQWKMTERYLWHNTSQQRMRSNRLLRDAHRERMGTRDGRVW